MDVITTFRIVCSRAGWLQWYNASCDMMVSDHEGNNDSDIIKRKVIFAKFTVTANRACEELCEKVRTTTTPHKGTGGHIDQLAWTARIQGDNSMSPKEPKCAKHQEQEFQATGHVIKSFQQQDAFHPLAAAVAATCSIGAAKELLAEARGMSKVLCAIPMLEQHHNEKSFREAVAAFT